MAYSHERGWYTKSEIMYEKEQRCLSRVLKEVDDLWDDPVQRTALLERCEKTHKELSHMSVVDMLKVYDTNLIQ